MNEDEAAAMYELAQRCLPHGLEVLRHGVGGAHRLAGQAAPGRRQERRQVRAQPAGVQRGVNAAYHGHAESASQQPSGVVNGGPDAGLVVGHGAHYRSVAGAISGPSPTPYTTIWAGDDRVAGRSGDRQGDPGIETGDEGQACRHHLLGAEADSHFCPDDRSGPHAQRNREQTYARGEGRIGPDELEVLSYQEYEPEQSERRDSDRSGGGAEPGIGE